jgi:hypothetical protein
MLPQDVAKQIKSFVYDIIRIPAVKKVVILQVLFRERHGSRCPDINQRVTELNTIIKRFALHKKMWYIGNTEVCGKPGSQLYDLMEYTLTLEGNTYTIILSEVQSFTVLIILNNKLKLLC